MKSHRFLNLLGAVLLAGILAVAFPGLSSAVFSMTTQDTVTVTAADDWTPPTVSVVAPGAFVRGPVAVVAQANDARSGVAKVTLERQAPGSTSWTPLCAPTAAPYSCSWPTGQGVDGQHALRATALDRAGYQATSTVVRTTVDNTAPTVTITDPGTAPLATGATLGSTVSDQTSGIARVVYQYAPTGSQNFQTLATSTAAPWTVTLPASVPDGRMDLRAVAIDRAGNERTSGTLVDRLVDNAPALAGVDIQTYNGTGTARRPDAGDTVVYTFNREVRPSSIIPGWNGSTRSVQYRISGGLWSNDVLEVAEAPNLGDVDLRRNYFLSLFGRSLPGTLTASTETLPDGSRRTRVTLQLGSISWLSTREADFADTMRWTPTNRLTDLFDNPLNVSSVAESDTVPDKEF